MIRCPAWHHGLRAVPEIQLAGKARVHVTTVYPTEISRRNVVTRYMFCVRKSLRGNIYGSLAPKSTLFAKFWVTLAMRRSPRRISFDGVVVTRPSTSGATIAGQKNRRKINAPTAVYLASWNRGNTADDICCKMSATARQAWLAGKSTMLQILRKDAGILAEEAQISSMKTFATMRS
jgi:hypothetical protein